MTSAGSLSRLDANIILLHLAPCLGLVDSLALAATSRFYRTLILHHALADNQIPAGLPLNGGFPQCALAAIMAVNIETAISSDDLLWILNSNHLPGLISLKIMGYHHISLQPNYIGMERLRTLTLPCSVASQFVANRFSGRIFKGLQSLNLEYDSGHQRLLPEKLFLALGPHSPLTTLAMSAGWACSRDGYHSSVLALLAALAVPSSAPPDLALLSLYFYNNSLTKSITIAARKSSLAHSKSAWRLGNLPSTTPYYFNIECWYSSYGRKPFFLSQAELDGLVALDEKTWHRARLPDFLVAPVHVIGNMLTHVGLLGTALEGIKIDMARTINLPTYLSPSITSITLTFMADETPRADAQPLLWAVAQSVEWFNLYTNNPSLLKPSVGPRIHELLVLPVMPNLTMFRTNIGLHVRDGESNSCALKKGPHGATRYEFGWIPKVLTLRIDGWIGCSTCWRDCGEGTLRHYIAHGAGGAGRVNVRGEYILSGETKKDVGCEKLWELYFWKREELVHL